MLALMTSDDTQHDLSVGAMVIILEPMQLKDIIQKAAGHT